MSKEIIIRKQVSNEIKKRIKFGEILIYPTDTGYGIGCNALNSDSTKLVKKIIGINDNKNISIIAPSKDWIYKNFKIKNKNYIKKLPGPFTFILEAKEKKFIKKLNLEDKEVRIKMPNHSFQKIIKKINIPMLNIELKNKFNIVDLKHIPRKIKRKSDIILDYGYIRKSPSATINLNKEIPTIVGR
jgi:tRNA threonylcarbamoyl adenosine modification protein (Sua5/YciO/YrdC/YwlC family)